MGIGASIFLIALGAIIAFGLNRDNVGYLDVDVVGWVLMLAGLAGLLLTLWFWQSRRRRVVRTTARPTVVDDDRGMYAEEYRAEVRRPERRY